RVDRRNEDDAAEVETRDEAIDVDGALRRERRLRFSRVVAGLLGKERSEAREGREALGRERERRRDHRRSRGGEARGERQRGVGTRRRDANEERSPEDEPVRRLAKTLRRRDLLGDEPQHV